MFRNSGSSAHVLPFLSHALFLAAFLLAAVVAPASAQEKPKIRTITAFIRLDPAQYKQQFADTLTMLRNAKARFGLAGYEVQTIRITTQPFPEYTRGMSKQAALALFHDLDALAKQENVSISIGPALMDEKDDPGQAELLAEILGTDEQCVRQRGRGRKRRRPLEGRSRGGGDHEISGGSRRQRPRAIFVSRRLPMCRPTRRFILLLITRAWDINLRSRSNPRTWSPR